VTALSFSVHVKLSYRIVSYRSGFMSRLFHTYHVTLSSLLYGQCSVGVGRCRNCGRWLYTVWRRSSSCRHSLIHERSVLTSSLQAFTVNFHCYLTEVLQEAIIGSISELYFTLMSRDLILAPF